jgi:hypothetical protein
MRRYRAETQQKCVKIQLVEAAIAIAKDHRTVYTPSIQWMCNVVHWYHPKNRKRVLEAVFLLRHTLALALQETCLLSPCPRAIKKASGFGGTVGIHGVNVGLALTDGIRPRLSLMLQQDKWRRIVNFVLVEDLFRTSQIVREPSCSFTSSAVIGIQLRTSNKYTVLLSGLLIDQ